MKRAALYARVSTVEQNFESQLCDLRQMAIQRRFVVQDEYTDRISGVKSKRPGLDRLMFDARRGKVDVVLVSGFDRLSRSVKHFLDVLDELNHLNIELVSHREGFDTSAPLGRVMMVLISSIAEIERNLIVERVKSGMRRARLEGRQIGRAKLDIDREQIVRDRLSGLSLTNVARKHSISRATVCRLVKESATSPQGLRFLAS